MATAGGRANRSLSSLRSLKERIFEQHGNFNVFQLLRLLRYLSDLRNLRDLRFRADLSAAFPGREISRLAEHDDHIDICTSNYCVAGTLGALPEPFTEWVRDQERMREHAMADFYNVFNQRLNMLRFELKSRQMPGLAGLTNLGPEQTPHAYYLASLMGLGQQALADQIPLPERAWLGLAGLLTNVRKSASTVVQVMSLFLRTGVALEQIVGAWQTIEEDDRIALGKNNHRLGRQSVLGRRVWDQQARVRLIVGPLTYQRFCLLLPSGPDYRRFTALLRLLLDRLCDCEVQLQVLTAMIPPAILTAQPNGLRLGQTAWLHSTAEANLATRTVTYLVHAFEQFEQPEAA